MGARVTVDKQGKGEFRVTVIEGATETAHTVTVDDRYYEELTGGTVPVDELVRRSFEFLLEREPKESILAAFALPVIGRYFPDYEREMKRRFGRR